MRLWLLLFLLVPCTPAPRPGALPSPSTSAIDASSPGLSSHSSGSAPEDLPPHVQLDSDGDDDLTEPTAGPAPSALRLETVGRAPLALKRICDLTPLGDALYAAHANQPLGTDGATISRYRPDDATRPFAVAFDWNRPGEPTNGGGSGQGFLRVHAIQGRLFVPDSDPPYAGFGLADHGTEGYVFVSDTGGAFAPSQMPGHRPPRLLNKDQDGGDVRRAGAGVVPRAYHVIDVIRFRGRLYASTGSVPPTERAWRGASPGALHVADASWARWNYEVDYPWPWQPGVWRLTYLVRYRDRLYAGIQDFDGREPNDYVVFSPPAEATALTHEHERSVRVTPDGGALTLRWYANAGRLWWIALERSGAAVLRVTDDGETWTKVALPADAGRPTDVVRFRSALVALTERGLWRIDVDPPAPLASVPDTRSPFAITDAFCAAPLAVFRGGLYAGSQRDGSLWRFAPALTPL